MSYATMTVHDFDENWELKNKVLFTVGFPTERNTAEDIKRNLQRRITDLGIDSGLLRNIKFVAD